MGLDEFAVQFCSTNECHGCPVFLNSVETRTDNEIKQLQIPCCTNIIEWIKTELNKE